MKEDPELPVRTTKTFYAMRRCQFAAWNEEMRESYLEDLTCAEEDGFNLITEKYARMMKYTAPEEYAEMEPFSVR